tara:strand:- start:5632 stop:8100 length:2469 start_codon:yes stop_codon:yes gene_type:complete
MNNNIKIISALLLIIVLLYLSKSSHESFGLGSSIAGVHARLKDSAALPSPDHTMNLSILEDASKAFSGGLNGNGTDYGYATMLPLKSEQRRTSVYEGVIPGAWTPRGLRGFTGGGAKWMFPIRKRGKEESPKQPFTVVSNYLFYIENYNGKMEIPLCIVMARAAKSNAIVEEEKEELKQSYIEKGVEASTAQSRAERRVKLYKDHFCLPRLIFDNKTKKIDIKNIVPEEGRKLISEFKINVGTGPLYTFDSEQRDFIDFGIKDGINQIAYVFTKTKAISVYINGVLFGNLYLRDDYDDRDDMVFHATSLFGDFEGIYGKNGIWTYVAEWDKNNPNSTKSAKPRPRDHDLIKLYIQRMRNNKIAEIYLRKVRIYKSTLHPDNIRNLYENREILMVGPRAFRQANFTKTGDFGEFTLHPDSDGTSMVFDENGVTFEQGIKVNVYKESSMTTPGVADAPSTVNADASENIIDASENIIDGEDENVTSVGDALSGMSFTEASEEIVKKAEEFTGFSREYRFRVYNLGNWNGTAKVKTWGIYNLHINKKNEIIINTFYDSRQFLKLENGVIYNLCEVVNGNTVNVYINGQLLSEVILKANTRSKAFLDNSMIKLPGSPPSGGIRIEYVGLKYFTQMLTPTEINLLVYERLSGIEDLDEFGSSGLKSLFKNVIGNFKRYKNKTKRELEAMLEDELNKLRESHRQEVADRERLLLSAKTDLLEIAEREKLLREQKIQEFLRENERIEKLEYETERRIKLKEKAIKKQKKRNKILSLLLVTFIALAIGIGIYNKYGDDIKEYLSGLFGDGGPNYDYMKRSRMPKFPWPRR